MDITATARKWEHGWELWLDGEAATQITTLDKAEQQVRDYLDTEEPDVDHSAWNIIVVPDIGPLGDEVAAARIATENAIAASAAAASESRRVVRHLREAGFSVTDSATILGVSRGRVSQLVSS